VKCVIVNSNSGDDLAGARSGLSCECEPAAEHAHEIFQKPTCDHEDVALQPILRDANQAAAQHTDPDAANTCHAYA
jgi:hypothetical protein